MAADRAVNVGVGRRRKAVVTAALALSATLVAVASGTSRAVGPLDSVAPVTQTVATAVTPVTQAVTTTTAPVTQAVTTTTAPVTQAVTTTTAPVTQAVATTTKPLTEAVATTTASVTQAVATTTKPLTQVTSAAAAPATNLAVAVAGPINRATTTAVRSSTSSRVASSPRSTGTGRAVASRAGVTPAGDAVARPGRNRIHAIRAGGGRAAALPQRTQKIAPPTRTVITLSPVTLASAAAAVTPSPAIGRAAPAAAVPTGGGSSSSAFGLAALIGAGGFLLLRARALSSAAGIDDPGTLMALGHAASTFWAGSCFSLGSGGTTAGGTMSASPTTDALSAVGDRARFGVRGAISGAVGAAGGSEAPPAASLAREAAGSDRTGLVAALLLVSAIIGAALGAIGPRERGAPAR
ncbi:MAG: hypothetical protein M3Q31_05995 [Actinomycetota bacterium]|nr:hypothetical protein [Actinomycetota bacterium]